MSEVLGRHTAQATFVATGDEAAEGLAISLTQPPGSESRWLMSVRARTDEGFSELGRFTTSPPSRNSACSRIVAVATCPGCREWTVLVRAAQGDAEGPALGEPDNSSVSLSIGCCGSGGEPGVVRVGERPKYYAGVDGSVFVLPGEELISWSAWAAGGGATVTIFGVDTEAAIPLPVSGTVEGGIGGLIAGPARLVFAGTGGYLVEVAESA